MRRLLPIVLFVLVAAACGSDDATMSKAEAEEIVERAQLTVDDLGEGWEKTSDEPSDDGTENDSLDECLGEQASEFDDDTLAEANERTFEKSTSEIGTQQIVSSNVVVEDEAAVEAFFDAVEDDGFAACFSKAFEAELAAEAQEGYTTTFEDPEIESDHVDGAGRSARISAPFTISVEGLEIDGRLDFDLAADGPFLAFVGATSIDEPIPPATLTGLLETVVERADV